MTITTTGPTTSGVGGGVETPQTLPGGTGNRERPRRNRIAYLYLFPIMVSAIVFTIVPFAITLYYSFTNYGLQHFTRTGPNKWTTIGWDNYRDILASGGEFYPVLGWTVAFMVLTTLINVGFGMFLALMLSNPNLPERNLYRTLLIIPWALPFILLIQVFTGIFNNQGPVNRIITDLGFDAVQWIPNFGDPDPSPGSLSSSSTSGSPIRSS